MTTTALLLMTFATGLVDAVSVLVLGHVFVANMTGNVVFLGLWLAPRTLVDITAAVVSFASFIVPMWLIAVGIVFTGSVTANGALAEFSDIAGTAVALHFCVQSLIVGLLGTFFVIGLGSDTIWPLAAYGLCMAALTAAALKGVQRFQLRQKAR